VLLLVETGLVTTVEMLGGIVGGFAGLAIIVGLLIAYPFASHFYTSAGLVSNSASHSRSHGQHGHSQPQVSPRGPTHVSLTVKSLPESSTPESTQERLQSTTSILDVGEQQDSKV